MPSAISSVCMFVVIIISLGVGCLLLALYFSNKRFMVVLQGLSYNTSLSEEGMSCAMIGPKERHTLLLLSYVFTYQKLSRNNLQKIDEKYFSHIPMAFMLLGLLKVPRVVVQRMLGKACCSPVEP